MGNKKIETNKSGTDPEFITMFAREANISPWEAKDVVNKFVNCLKKCIDLNGHVNVRRLGRLYIRQRKRSRFRNFNGKMVEIPLIYMLKFKASDSIRSFVNRKLIRDRDNAKKGNIS